MPHLAMYHMALFERLPGFSHLPKWFLSNNGAGVEDVLCPESHNSAFVCDETM